MPWLKRPWEPTVVSEPPLRVRQGGFQLQRFRDRLVDEVFDGLFSPRLQRSLAKTTSEPFDPRKADAADLIGVSVEDNDPRIDK